MLRMAMAFLLVLLAEAATPLTAQVRYKDSEGVTHWVTSKDEVPEQYRAGAVGQPIAPPPGKQSDVDRQREQERDARRGPPDRFVMWQSIDSARPKNWDVLDSKAACESKIEEKIKDHVARGMEQGSTAYIAVSKSRDGKMASYVSYQCLPVGVNP